jgi:hypothetical protein
LRRILVSYWLGRKMPVSKGVEFCPSSDNAPFCYNPALGQNSNAIRASEWRSILVSCQQGGE